MAVAQVRSVRQSARASQLWPNQSGNSKVSALASRNSSLPVTVCPARPPSSLTSRSFDDEEGPVVIRGVVQLPVLPGDDPPGSASARAGGGHGEFAVVPARLRRQLALPILEGRAVLAVGV